MNNNSEKKSLNTLIKAFCLIFIIQIYNRELENNLGQMKHRSISTNYSYVLKMIIKELSNRFIIF